MAFRDPVVAYTTSVRNLNAVILQNALLAAGIEAFITEDVSEAGGPFRCQIWIERGDMIKASLIFSDFERRLALRDDVVPGTGLTIEAVCEECGGSTSFPRRQRGSVQQCPHCDAYLDVDDDEQNETGIISESLNRQLRRADWRDL